MSTAINANRFSVTNWDSYIGQERAKQLVQLKIKNALRRGDRLDHMLILGASGYGKTEFAKLVAQEYGVNVLEIMCTPNMNISHINKQIMEFDMDRDEWPDGDIGEGVDPIEVKGGGILILDEAHLLDKKKQHNFYSLLHDGYIANDKGKKFFLQNPLTIIACTTDEQFLTESLRQRFGRPIRLERYHDENDMPLIVEGMFGRLGVNEGISTEMLMTLGKAANGSPRAASQLVKMADELGEYQDPKLVLSFARITEDGLTEDHVAYLDALNKLGGQSGFDNVVSHCQRPKSDVIEFEKLLVSRQFIELVSRGRKLTAEGKKALHMAERIFA